MNLRSRIPGSAFLLFAVATAACATACSKEEPAKTGAWSCATADVPMGEVVRCTQSALTTDSNQLLAPTDTTTLGDTTTSYDCVSGSPDCPVDTSGGSGGSTTTSGSVSSDTTSGSGDTTGGAGGTTTSGSSGTVGSDGTSATGDTTGGAGGSTTSGSSGAPVGSDSTSSTGNGNGNGKGASGGSSIPGPDECSWVEDLPYCGGTSSSGAPVGSTGTDSSGTTSSSSSSSSGSSGSDSTLPPGQEKKSDASGTSSSGGASSSSSSGSASSASTNGNGKSDTHWHCQKDAEGNKVCEATPKCAAGTKPSACGACVPEGESADCVSPSDGGCWVTGGGFIVAANDVSGAAADGHDNFGGNAKPMKDGRIQGNWNHVDHGTGNHAKGKPAYIVCRHVDEPGPGQPGGKKGFTMNQVYFGGPAQWRDAATGAWADGYWFDVVAKDHGEPGSVPNAKNGQMVDTYHFTIRKMDDPTNQVSGAKIYETHGGLEGGNIQLHPPNNGHPYTPSALPTWVSLEP